MTGLTLRKIRNTTFNELYERLALSQRLEEGEITKLLKVAVVFLNSENEDVRKLGYRIVVLYSNLYNDYVPLYDLSINLGYFPVSKLAEKMIGENLFKEKFLLEFQSSLQDAFKVNQKYFTHEQENLYSSFARTAYVESNAIVAPTSYGKTELIMTAIRENKNMVVVVPTKALLAQTKKRILTTSSYQGRQKIITHHEMYAPGDQNFIAVLTQERLIKLLQKNNGLSFDIAFIDEAHNLLEDTERSRLLATSILLLNQRNPSMSLNFLTPFLLKFENLQIEYMRKELRQVKINEYIKSEKVFLIDLRSGGNQLEMYDQFLDKFVNVPDGQYTEDINLIKDRASDKNIIYLNRPPDIENFVHRFADTLPAINDPDLESACNSIKDYLHEDYSLLKCIRRGIVFHHGSVPDNIKLYIEHLYSKSALIKYIVTTSTLLEGVNIPSNKIFLLSNKKGRGLLTPSQFKNLIGRICRFSEIFGSENGHLNLLVPEVYCVASEYTSERQNLKTFLKKALQIDRKLPEVADNILLQETTPDAEQVVEKAEFEKYLENLQPRITGKQGFRYATTDVGRSCFANSVFEFDILENEVACQQKIENLKSRRFLIKDTEDLLETIFELFIRLVRENEGHRNLLRLRELGARNFYKMIVDWRLSNFPYKRMIGSFLRYWEEIERTNVDAYVYVGRWGDRKKRGEKSGTDWVNLREKTTSQRVNLAIVRIKDEQDFVENKLFKFVEVLNDVGLIDPNLFLQIKFGTSDTNKILLIKNGLSLSLASLLLEKYTRFLTLDLARSSVVLQNEVIDEMSANNENQILIFEASLNVKG